MITSGMSKKTIIAQEGRYIIEVSDKGRAGISGTGKDRAGVARLADIFSQNHGVTFSLAERAAGGDWEKNPESFSTLLKVFAENFERGSQGILGFTFIPNSGSNLKRIEIKPTVQ